MSNKDVEDEQFSSPSFSSYSENKIAEIADKVASEENPRNDGVPDEGGEDYDDDFEFSLQLPEDAAWEVNVSSGDFNGQIFPVFNRDLLPNDDESRIAVPLSILLKKENSFRDNKDIIHSSKDTNNSNGNIDSCSSSEADELENIPSGTYCVWRPNKCKKSQSAGSASKRWASLRDLMKRSNSEGMKDNIVFLTPKKKNKEDHKAKEITKTAAIKGSSSSAHEEFYVRNRAVKEGDRKKSYLPYRKELVGFFVNGNGFLPHV